MNICILVALFITGTLAGPAQRRQLNPNDRCKTICPQQYEPVCGSDRHTYSNVCMFAAAACEYRQKGLSLRMVHRGSCSSSGNQIGQVDPRACDIVCDEERQPVCASDGQVYANTCLYKRAECEAAKNHTHLFIVAKGDTCPTPKTPNCQQYQIDTSDLAVEGGGSLSPACPITHKYVCASDSHSYSNECQLCHHMEIANVDLTIIYEGACHNGAGLFGSLTDPKDSLLDLLNGHL